ncbi:FAD-dependent oxidoreductase [Calditrichota bacterium]
MKVVIIGGSAAGLKAGCRIARLQPDAEVIVLEKSIHFGYSACSMPYFLSGDIPDYQHLVSTAHGVVKDVEWYKEVKGINVRPQNEVIEIDKNTHSVKVYDQLQNDSYNLGYDRLVIATGTMPILPDNLNLESDKVLHFSSPDDAKKLHHLLSTGQLGSVAIIGGGFIGLELCEAFRSLWGIDVTLIELQGHVLANGYDPEIGMLVEDELIRNDVNLLLGCKCESFEVKGSRVHLQCTGSETVTFDRVVVAVGVKPDVRLAESAGLEIGISGGIQVDRHMQTSDPDVFAAGDCIEYNSIVDEKAGIWSLGSLANRTGRIAGDNVCGTRSYFGNVAGTNIFKVFDLTVGSVGLSESGCSQRRHEATAVWATFYDKVHSYPDTGKLHLKLVYEKSTGRMMGLQGVGAASLVNVLDKAALYLHAGAFVEELTEIEHAYSPPYSQPFDPLHNLSFLTQNRKIASVGLTSPSEFLKLDPNTIILDVRTESEIAEQSLPVYPERIIHVQLEELRRRLAEIPSGGQIVVVCQMGARSWDAALILKSAGWRNVNILAGGAMFLPMPRVNAVNMAVM